MAKIYRIYQAKAPSGKIYVGLTSQALVARRGSHYAAANSGRKGQGYFWAALRKYGPEVVWSVLEDGIHGGACAAERECFWIKRLRTMDRRFGYNLTPGGHVIPPSACGKLSQAAKDSSFETRKRMSVSAKERGMTAVQLQNLEKGRERGCRHTPEAKEKIRKAHLGRKLSEKTRQRMSVAHQKIRHTQEQRRKIKEANLRPLARSDGKTFGSGVEASREMGLRDDAVSKSIRRGGCCCGFIFQPISIEEYQHTQEII